MSRPPKDSYIEYTELERDLLEAADAMLAHAKEKSKRIHENNIDVRFIRSELHFTQEQFASFIGVSVHAVRHWENGRRLPDGAARTLLQVLHHSPQAVLDALNHPNE